MALTRATSAFEGGCFVVLCAICAFVCHLRVQFQRFGVCMLGFAFCKLRFAIFSSCNSELSRKRMAKNRPWQSTRATCTSCVSFRCDVFVYEAAAGGGCQRGAHENVRGWLHFKSVLRPHFAFT